MKLHASREGVNTIKLLRVAFNLLETVRLEGGGESNLPPPSGNLLTPRHNQFSACLNQVEGSRLDHMTSLTLFCKGNITSSALCWGRLGVCGGRGMPGGLVPLVNPLKCPDFLFNHDAITLEQLFAGYSTGYKFLQL